MLASHHEDLSAQHYHTQPQAQPQYQGYGHTAQTDFSSYGPMYSNYMKCRTNPYQRPTASGASTPTSPNMPTLPSPAGMYYPGFSNAAAAAAAAAAGLYTRPHNMYDYTSGTMHHHAEVPRWNIDFVFKTWNQSFNTKGCRHTLFWVFNKVEKCQFVM